MTRVDEEELKVLVQKALEKTHRTFFTEQLGLRFELHSKNGRTYPTFREILATKSPSGKSGGFLALDWCDGAPLEPGATLRQPDLARTLEAEELIPGDDEDEEELIAGEQARFWATPEQMIALARHGAAGSSFADWWAYKYEAWDAIPYDGALMHGAGVLVSFNSDDAELARRYPDLQFVLPVHPNPEVKQTVVCLLCDVPGMHLIEPMDYVEFVHLMNRAYLVLTDSGGVQEEAPSLGKPVLVLREVTERPEGVEAGTAVVVGTDRDRIVRVASQLLDSRSAYERMANAVNPYGDGRASGRIVTALAERFG